MRIEYAFQFIFRLLNHVSYSEEECRTKHVFPSSSFYVQLRNDAVMANIFFINQLLQIWFKGWRREEIEKIDASKSGPERKAALVGLLEQESYLIASIERHRIKASKENKESNIKKFLDKVSKWINFIYPLIWVGTWKRRRRRWQME